MDAEPEMAGGADPFADGLAPTEHETGHSGEVAARSAGQLRQVATREGEDTDRTEERTFPRIQRHCHNQVSAEPIQGRNRIGDYMNKKESLIKIDEQIRKSSASRNISSKRGIK